MMSSPSFLILGFLFFASCNRGSPPASNADSADTSQTPSMQILSPRPGDRWAEGTAHVIRWKAIGIPAINLGAAVGGKDKGHLLLNAASSDSLVWTIPVGFVTGFGPDSSNQVRIRLENAADPTQFVEAGPFTILRQKPH